jgi:hypothetical protein
MLQFMSAAAKRRDVSESQERVRKRARALARSGTFAGWRAVAFELQFEPDCREGLGWLQILAAQEEIDDLCREARARSPSPRRDLRVHDPKVRDPWAA